MNESQPVDSVRVKLHPKDFMAEGWAGSPEWVTLDLMPDGSVRWRHLEVTSQESQEPTGSQ